MPHESSPSQPGQSSRHVRPVDGACIHAEDDYATERHLHSRFRSLLPHASPTLHAFRDCIAQGAECEASRPLFPSSPTTSLLFSRRRSADCRQSSRGYSPAASAIRQQQTRVACVRQSPRVRPPKQRAQPRAPFDLVGTYQRCDGSGVTPQRHPKQSAMSRASGIAFRITASQLAYVQLQKPYHLSAA